MEKELSANRRLERTAGVEVVCESAPAADKLQRLTMLLSLRADKFTKHLPNPSKATGTVASISHRLYNADHVQERAGRRWRLWEYVQTLFLMEQRRLEGLSERKLLS